MPCSLRALATSVPRTSRRTCRARRAQVAIARLAPAESGDYTAARALASDVVLVRGNDADDQRRPAWCPRPVGPRPRLAGRRSQRDDGTTDAIDASGTAAERVRE